MNYEVSFFVFSTGISQQESVHVVCPFGCSGRQYPGYLGIHYSSILMSSSSSQISEVCGCILVGVCMGRCVCACVHVCVCLSMKAEVLYYCRRTLFLVNAVSQVSLWWCAKALQFGTVWRFSNSFEQPCCACCGLFAAGRPDIIWQAGCTCPNWWLIKGVSTPHHSAGYWFSGGILSATNWKPQVDLIASPVVPEIGLLFNFRWLHSTSRSTIMCWWKYLLWSTSCVPALVQIFLLLQYFQK